MREAMGRPWVIKTQPDNVDQLLQTAAVLLSARSADGGGAGHQCHSGGGEPSACFFISQVATLGALGLMNLQNIDHREANPAHSSCFHLFSKYLSAFRGYILC